MRIKVGRKQEMHSVEGVKTGLCYLTVSVTGWRGINLSMQFLCTLWNPLEYWRRPLSDHLAKECQIWPVLMWAYMRN